MITPAAEQDLLDIWQYIALDNEQQATKFLSELREKICNLSLFPFSGIQRDDLHKGIFLIIHKKYSIFYIVKNESVLIARVLHGSRETKDLL
jgi:toxin ParE1/3/4